MYISRDTVEKVDITNRAHARERRARWRGRGIHYCVAKPTLYLLAMKFACHDDLGLAGLPCCV
jgi:hypothetical protein